MVPPAGAMLQRLSRSQVQNPIQGMAIPHAPGVLPSGMLVPLIVEWNLFFCFLGGSVGNKGNGTCLVIVSILGCSNKHFTLENS